MVGVLCAGREATKGVREAVRNARRGIVWCQIEDMKDGVGRVRQLLWNQRVSALGAEGVGVGLRYLSNARKAKEEAVDNEVVLTWRGDPWAQLEVHQEKSESSGRSSE